MALRALKTKEEIGSLPLDKAVLLELPDGVNVEQPDEPGVDDEGKQPDTTTQDDGSQKLQEQLEAALAAQKAGQGRAERADPSVSPLNKPRKP
jgi:hypothetical protein